MDLAALGVAALIFVARVADVSLGTLRTAFIVRGKRAFAFGVGFVEVLVWVMVVAQVITNLDRPIYIVAFALGFATGTVVGITVEGWFAIGEQVIRVFTVKGESVASAVRERGFMVTTFAGKGRDGTVHLLFIKVPRRRTRAVLALARQLDPMCFFTVEDVRLASVAVAKRPAPAETLPLVIPEQGSPPAASADAGPVTAAVSPVALNGTEATVTAPVATRTSEN